MGLPRFLSFGLCTTDFNFTKDFILIPKTLCMIINFYSGSKHFLTVINLSHADAP
jgi:hypothetical protein